LPDADEMSRTLLLRLLYYADGICELVTQYTGCPEDIRAW
jgi:hypothetical protein